MSDFDEYLCWVHEKSYASILDYWVPKTLVGRGNFLGYVLAGVPDTDFSKRRFALESGWEELPAHYDGQPVPEHYKCSKCGAKGLKLWRLSLVFAEHVKLFCGECACLDQGKDSNNLGDDGKFGNDNHGRTDQIGWLVPAIPCGDTYWGYASVPQPGVLWWSQLPTRLGS